MTQSFSTRRLAIFIPCPECPARAGTGCFKDGEECDLHDERVLEMEDMLRESDWDRYNDDGTMAT